jgi:hypothetical protein
VFLCVAKTGTVFFSFFLEGVCTMCRKLIYLVSSILVLSLASNALADLVGHWEFEGDFKDSSAGHDGDPRGNATIVYDVTRNSNVLSLPGGLLDGDAVATPAIGDLDEFTIMMWINAETLGSGADKISFFSTPAAASVGLQIQSRAQNLQVLVGTGEGTNKIDGSALSLNEWFHLAVTFKSDELAGYINGELDVSKVLTAAPAAAVGEAYIGNWANPDGLFVRGLTGKMDDVRIYDTVLSQEEILQTMASAASTQAHEPQPSTGAKAVPLDQVLSLTTGLDPDDANVPNPEIAQHNLWLSAAYDPMDPPAAGPDWQDPGKQVFQIPADTNPADGNVDPNASYSLTGLQRDAIYYWIVDESLVGATGLEDWDNIIVGAMWSFETITSGPEVDAGRSILTWLKEGTTTVDLSGTVTDATGDVTATTWSVVSSPFDSIVSIASSSAAVTTATLFQTGTYVLELHAVDAALNEDTDQMEISVYSDSCQAAQNNPDGYTAPLGDVNNDCKMDFVDFAILAAAWLDDASLTEDALYDPN